MKSKGHSEEAVGEQPKRLKTVLVGFWNSCPRRQTELAGSYGTSPKTAGP